MDGLGSIAPQVMQAWGPVAAAKTQQQGNMPPVQLMKMMGSMLNLLSQCLSTVGNMMANSGGQGCASSLPSDPLQQLLGGGMPQGGMPPMGGYGMPQMNNTPRPSLNAGAYTPSQMQDAKNQAGTLLNSFDAIKRPDGFVHREDLEKIGRGERPAHCKDLVITPELQQSAAQSATSNRMESADARINGGDTTLDGKIGKGDLQTIVKEMNKGLMGLPYKV